MIFWLWFFFFPMFVGVLGFFGGLFFLNSGYLVSWDITVFREVNYEMLFLVDSFSLIFLFTVGLVSSFVLIYSNYYMMESMYKEKFIYTLMVFIVSMFVLSLSGDLFWIMIGWDGLGFSSMCLIFFFSNWKSFNSSMVTFISNRVGDFFIISFFSFMILISGDLFFEGSVSSFFFSFFLCLGAFSKSAQVPFSAWLPQAMAAPTPVSSLVHSSTLVTAGVFLLVRFKSFLNKGSFFVILIFSFITILLAGFSSLGEYDLKKVIALSTLSHIGLMMMFVGMESFVSAKIHLVIHAFFKSLLFMVSGFVIHENSNFQDIRSIYVYSGNYFFSITFILSSFSMMGAPFFSGFFSKEIFLGWVFDGMGSFMYILLFFFSVMATCSYSIRLMVYFFLPSSSLIPLVSGGDYPSKVFFFMSLMSSFFSGVMVFSLVGEEGGSVMITNFSLFQKFGLLLSIVLGLFLGMVFCLNISSLNSYLLMVCHSMWMINSVNLVTQGMSFKLSFFMMMSGDVKGLLDFFVYSSNKMFSCFSNFLLMLLFSNPFIYLNFCSFLMMSIFFFI